MGKKMKSDEKFVVAHRASKDGKHLVAAQLRVLVCPSDDGGFVAQGLEIDYLSTGRTVEEVKNNFASGLIRTIEAYIKRNRPLSGLFAKGRTPPEAWELWLDGDRKDVLTCGTVVDLALPENTSFFSSIAFREAEVAHAA